MHLSYLLIHLSISSYLSVTNIDPSVYLPDPHMLFLFAEVRSMKFNS
jgi:hypothetical protein